MKGDESTEAGGDDGDPLQAWSCVSLRFLQCQNHQHSREEETMEWNSDGKTSEESHSEGKGANNCTAQTHNQDANQKKLLVATDLSKSKEVCPAVPLTTSKGDSSLTSLSTQDEGQYMPLAHYHSSATWISDDSGDDQGKEYLTTHDDGSNICKPLRSSGLFRKRRRNWIVMVSVGVFLLVAILVVMASLGVFQKNPSEMTPSSGGSSDSDGNETSDTDVETDDDEITSTREPPTATDSSTPASSPTASPTNPPRVVTYRPGELIVEENGLILSRGLKSRILAKTGDSVKYKNGQESSIPFHIRPDGAAVFVVPDGRNKGGWVYVSNSEGKEKNSGGVGAVVFDKNGNVIEYKNLLNGTTMNCGGGKTPWDTWVSCEEWASTGQVYQVDPFGRRPAEKTTVGKMQGGRYEAFAYDDRNKTHPVFYITEDQRNGPTRRWRPNPSIVDLENEPWNILHGEGTLDYLVLEPNDDTDKSSGTYSWETSIHKARANARSYYQSAEGIDRHDNLLYMSCKREKMLYVIDLDSNKYIRYSLAIALFDGEPDQVTRILNDTSDIMYFNEDLGSVSGIHARNPLGQMFTVLEGPGWTNEATGLAFSPSARHMYLCFQEIGVMFEITREDGYPFHGRTLNIRYHNEPVEVPWSRGLRLRGGSS